MKIQQMRDIARDRRLNPGRLGKVELIRAIQRAEGNFDCFATAHDGVCDQSQCLWLRALSLFHVLLPVLLLWLLYWLGYDRRALPATMLLCWVVLPVTYLFTDPAQNINWVFRLGGHSKSWSHN